MKKIVYLLVAFLLIKFALAQEKTLESIQYEDILDAADEDDEEALFLKDTFRAIGDAGKRVVNKVGDLGKRGVNKVGDALKTATDKFANAVKKGFNKVLDLVNNESTKDENNLCRQNCPISNTNEQKDKEVIALLASIGSYSTTQKIKKLSQLKEKLGRFGNWNLNTITEKGKARAITLSNPNKRQFIVAFRGTVKTSIQDWIVNLKLGKSRNPWGEGEIHNGFLGEVRDIIGDGTFSSNVDLHLRSGFEFIITGHSQGAAEASVFAAYILSRHRQLGVSKPVISLIVFAPPRPGDKTFATWLMRNVPNSVRFQNSRDVVPKVPMIMLGFHHVGALYENICTKTFLQCHSTSRFFYYTRESRWRNNIPSQSTMCADSLVKEVLGGICE